jgi:vanillate/4-hydroxybenzoate decarboxylase subunit D
MSQATPPGPNAVCPRCRSTTIEVHTTSPVAGVWTVYGCATCFYAWRSTEPEENTDPDRYPTVFRLTPADLARFAVVPRIPPLRRT